MTAPLKSSYGQILRSSALVGASSAIEIAFRVVRAKVIALWLGPAGVGLFGLYTSVADVAVGVAGLGFEASGVRQVALATGSADPVRVARTARVLARSCAVLGALGALLLFVLAAPVSRLTFGSEDHAVWVAVLGAAVLLRLVAAGRTATLRGLRRIGDLARTDVSGAVLGTIATLVLVYRFREDGVVPSIVATAAALAAAAWWFGRRARLPAARVGAREAAREVRSLFRLGFAFLVTGLLTLGVAYVVRVLVLREAGVEAAGHYQAAWTIGSLYVGFVLQAMGTDFYPRLTAVAGDPDACNQLVNEQAQISMLLAGPGLLATLTFAPLLITLFYSSEFRDADGALRWICLGMSLRVITWPLGFIVVAKGLQQLFIWTDAICAAVHVALAWLLVPLLGVDGAGLAFLGLYGVHALLMMPIARRLTGFRWSEANRRIGAGFLLGVSAVLTSFAFLPEAWALGLGSLVFVLGSALALRALVRLVAPDRVPAPIRRVMGLFGLGATGAVR